MIPSVVFGLFNMLFMGVANSMAKVPTKVLGTHKFLFIRTALTSCLMALVLLFNLSVSHFILSQIALALVLSVIAYIALNNLYRSYSLGKLGVVAPICASYPIISLFLSKVFLNINIEVNQIIAVAIIFGAIFLGSANFMQFKQSDLFSSKSGIPQAFLCCLFFGIFFFLAQIPNKILGPYLASLVFELGILFCSLIYLAVKKVKLEPKDKNINYKTICLLAAFNIAGALTFYYGLANYNTAVILILSGSTPLVATLYGFLFYKEKLSSKQWLANLAIVAGAVMLAV